MRQTPERREIRYPAPIRSAARKEDQHQKPNTISRARFAEVASTLFSVYKKVFAG
jgi:hypothetical protein